VAANQPTSLTGRTLGGCQLLEIVGKGGMGTVYRARNAAGRIVAVKVLAPEHVANDVLRTRFYLEAKLAMSIAHPNIVRALEVGEEDGRHYLVMEFIEGESLNKRVLRDGPMPEDLAVRCAVAVARALDKAHREGLVHRDVKPDNILLTPSGDVKLTDLGLAKKADVDLDLTRPGRGLGTPHFMPPEQFKNAKSVDAKTDIYALGATLYVLVTGKVPFRGDGPLDTFIKKTKNLYTPVEQLAPKIGERTRKVIAACMEVDPAKRPASAAAIADYLEGKTQKLRLGEPVAELVDVAEPVWYVKNQGPNGTGGLIRGPESTIKRHIARGQIGPAALAGKSKRGPYRPIASIPEFQALIATASLETPVQPHPRPAAAGRSAGGLERWLDLRVFAVCLVVGMVCLASIAWYLLVVAK
jgi:serine/threonine protein kinase